MYILAAQHLNSFPVFRESLLCGCNGSQEAKNTTYSLFPSPGSLVWACECGPIQYFLLALEGELRACSCDSTSQSATSEEGSVVRT